MEVKKNLLSALRLVFYFICICILSCTLFASVYMVYSLCENLVAGQNLTFDINLFVAGLFAAAPFVFMFSAMFMLFYLIRHSIVCIGAIVAYCVLYVLSWFVFIPTAVKCNDYFMQENKYVAPSDMPSAFYFRPDGEHVFYYTSVANDTRKVSGFCINTNSDAPVVYLFSDLEMLPKTSDFTDSLIKNSLDIPPIISIAITELNILSVILKKCVSGNFLYWLCFSTMGLALLSVFGLRNFSRWRLVNVLIVIGASCAILLFNIFGYTNNSFVSVGNSVNNVLNKVGLFKNISSVGNLFIMFGNIFICAILVVVGIILDRNYKLQKERESGDDLL